MGEWGGSEWEWESGESDSVKERVGREWDESE